MITGLYKNRDTMPNCPCFVWILCVSLMRLPIKTRGKVRHCTAFFVVKIQMKMNSSDF